jgi:hypothetical protein
MVLLGSTVIENSTLQFSITDVSSVYNNHVGNEWYHEVQVEYGGKQYKLSRYESTTISFKPGYDGIKIIAYSQENDKYPDYASTTKDLSVQRLLSSKPIEIELYTIVKEGHGRYAGNTAKWQFKVRVE